MKNANNLTFRRIDLLILGTILLIALIMRLYKIQSPLADFHSWRQADTAAVARNFVKNGFDLLHPKYDDLSNIQSGQYNPQGYRMVEFPLYNAMFSALFQLYPTISLEIYGRLVSIISSLIVIFVIYYLCLKEVNRIAAVCASIIYSVFPFFVFFSRVILPESTAMAMISLSILSAYLYAKNDNWRSVFYYIFSAIFFALALLIKPTVIFYGVAIGYLFYLKYGLNLFKKFYPYLYFFVALLPLLLWRNYIRSFPEGIPVSQWLFFQVNTAQGLQSIFFKPSFFRWVFFERINNNILGGYLTLFLFLGILKKTTKLFPYTLLLSAIIYLFTFQGGNVQHTYYQTLILMPLAIFTGTGLSMFYQKTRNSSQLISPILLYPTIIGIVTMAFYFSFFTVKDFYNYPINLINTAKIIKTLTRPDEKIVTDTTGDTTLLYLSDRKGYPAPTKEFEELKKDGMSYFVTMNHEVIQSIKKQGIYHLLFEDDTFAMFQL